MSTTPPIRTLIVDDEPLARDVMRLLLQRQADVEIVGECGHGAEAITALERGADSTSSGPWGPSACRSRSS
jgi:DNA-binding LytR/AlgR family response regulator